MATKEEEVSQALMVTKGTLEDLVARDLQVLAVVHTLMQVLQDHMLDKANMAVEIIKAVHHGIKTSSPDSSNAHM